MQGLSTTRDDRPYNATLRASLANERPLPPQRTENSTRRGAAEHIQDDDADDTSVEVLFSSRDVFSKRGKKKAADKSWYGLERPSTRERAITTSMKVLRKLEADRFKLREVFQTRYAAEKWLNKIVGNNSETEGVDSDDSVEFQQAPIRRATKPKDSVPVQSSHVPAPVIDELNTLPIKKVISLASEEFFHADTAGNDSSNGNEEKIYGISHDNIDEMDEALCPPHMAVGEREHFMDSVIDILALPGMFFSNNGVGEQIAGVDIATAIVATALGKKKSSSEVIFQTAGRNALSKIKTQAHPTETINGVERSMKIVFQQQEGRMRAVMYRCGYDQPSIQLYLQAGLLPRMVRASYARYIALLYKIRQKVIDHGGWTTSLVYQMVNYHAYETLTLRKFAVDWRDFLIKTYVFLRDAERKSFVDTTMYEPLFKPLEEEAPPVAPARAKPETHICSHCKCKINEAHPGGKTFCCFQELNSHQAREAGKLLLLALK